MFTDTIIETQDLKLFLRVWFNSFVNIKENFSTVENLLVPHHKLSMVQKDLVWIYLLDRKVDNRWILLNKECILCKSLNIQ